MHLSCGSDELLGSVGVLQQLIRGTLDDTTSDGERGTHAGQIRINIPSCLTSFVDAPDFELVFAI